MKKVYRYTVEVFLADFLGKNRLIDILEFDTISEKIRVSYKESEPQNFEFINPNEMKEIDSERKVKIEVVVKSEDIEKALFRAQNVLEEKIAIISFLSMYPVKLINEGSISEELTETAETIEMLIPSTKGKAIFNADLIESIELLFNHPDDKIIQSLRWFRKGLLDSNPFDSFISLWIAFEIISSKLKPTDKKLLKCPRCSKEIELCPHCNKSTETRVMEKDGIINHIHNTLGIEDKDYYKNLNNMRNDIFHGRLRKIKMDNVKREVGKLSYCLITAYWFLVYGQLPNDNLEMFKRFSFYFVDQNELAIKMELNADAIREIRNDPKFEELKIK